MSCEQPVLAANLLTEETRVDIRNSIVDIMAQLDQMICIFDVLQETEDDMSPEDLSKIEKLAGEMSVLHSHLEICKQRIMASVGARAL